MGNSTVQYSNKIKGKNIIFSLFISIFLISIASCSGAKATTVGFDAGKIVDDLVFTNDQSMGVGQIQTFLNSKVASCDTNGSLPATDFGRSDLTHAQYAALKGWSAPPYTCLKDYYENGVSSAQIIYNVSLYYHINPQVFIVLLQKEQGLVTDSWPLATQYKTATGYGCPDTAVCSSQYFGLTAQLNWAGTLFHTVATGSQSWSNPYGSGTSWYSPYILGSNLIYWNPNLSCGDSTVNILNRSTAALYDYTPYRPNQAALDAGYGSGDSCSAYGNRNFYNYFTDWFGSTYAYIYNGTSYSAVFDGIYYLNKYPDVKSAYGDNAISAFTHFVNYGMSEGRQGSDGFDVISYKNRYPDLRAAFGNNLTAYYLHYIRYGKSEGRIATGDEFNGTSMYNGVNYSAVYNFDYYEKNNPDIKAAFGLDDNRVLSHFINYGMAEGRQGNADFNVNSYKNRYYDLRRLYGDNVRAYAVHYILYGKQEGRIAIGDYLGGISKYSGVDYSAVYNFDYYEKNNPDIKAAFGLDDNRVLSHFINYGMAEGRQGNADFNVNLYKANYIDLRTAYGQNLRLYYLHYIYYGKAEARTAI